MSPIESRNPATGDCFAAYPSLDPDSVHLALDRSVQAQQAWARESLSARCGLLVRTAKVLGNREDAFASLMSREMGKPITQARAEIRKCALVCEYYAREAPGQLADEPVKTEARRSFVSFDPLGVILAVMPWNFPFWQVFRFAAPALAAGNGAILKHASNVPGSALAVEEAFREAGAPAGLFQTLLLKAEDAAQVAEDSRIAAVTLTGSEEAGRALGSRAGRGLKKCVLELGGSDPFLVFHDADLPRCAAEAVTARTQNTGQSCIAAKRFLVHRQVHDAFVTLFKEKMSALAVGDPLKESTEIGPLARPDLVVDLERQVDASVRLGARIVLGGKALTGPGCFYPPTLLVDAGPGMPAWEEETFGPVAAVSAFSTEEEAVRLANDSRFGLGASVWTADLQRADRVARSLQAGCIFINSFVKSDPRLPFGGIKTSGHGRELSSYGIREFVNIKTVWMEEG